MKLLQCKNIYHTYYMCLPFKIFIIGAEKSQMIRLMFNIISKTSVLGGEVELQLSDTKIIIFLRGERDENQYITQSIFKNSYEYKY